MPYIAVDFETTGFSPSKHRIVEIGAVVFEKNGTVLDTFHSLVNPGGVITATAVHGISEADLVEAPSFAEVLPSFADALNGHTIVAHNAPFDVSFLQAELRRAGLRQSRVEALCTLDLISRLRPDLPRKLTKCCESLGITLLSGHHALNDARMTAQLASFLFLDAQGIDRVSSTTLVVPRTLKTKGRLPHPREAEYRHASESGEFFSKLITLLPVSSKKSDLADSRYLATLEEALVDGEITKDEAEDLSEVAKICGLGQSRIRRIHLEYFARICEVAAANNYVSAKEKSRLKKLALMLAVDGWEEILDSLTSIVVWKPGDPIRTGPVRGSKATANFSKSEEATDWSEPSSKSRLRGLRFVLTGTFSSFSREQGREAIIRRGGLSPEDLSSKTDVLVAGDASGPKKLEKATALGIHILNEAEFLEVLKTGRLPER